MKNISKFLSTTNGKLVAIFIMFILVLLSYYFYKSQSIPEIKEPVVINEDDHIRGNQSGDVTLVEFGDFQCPACAAYEPFVRKVTEDNKNLKVVFKHFPLTQIHKNALLSAKASESAGIQGKFWEMHDMLYDKQKEWGESLMARELIISYAKTLNLDVDKFTKDLNDKAIEDRILSDLKEGIKLGVQGTPSFFVNGKKIENPKSLEEFNKVIREASK